MGDAVGVHDEAELAGLTAQQRDQVKGEILRQLQTSSEIRAIIDKEPRLLTRNKDINDVLKRVLAPFLARLRGS
jgi:hypothetical protein